jgi:hypothetical protein
MRAPFRPHRVASAWGVATVAAVGILLASFAESWAQPVGPARAVALSWTVPEECPDIEYVEHEIGRLLAGATTPITALLRARAEVKRGGESAWHVVLETDSSEGGGRRAFTAESCRAAADATALILALAVDPERVATNQSATASASGPPPASASTSEASNTAPSASAPPVSPPPPLELGTPASLPRPEPQREASSPPSRLSFAVAGGFDLGTLPSYSEGVFAMVGFAPGLARWLRFEGGAALFANESPNQPGADGVFSLRTFDLGVCALPLTGQLELGACADGELAWMTGTGLGEATTISASATWLVARPRVTFAYSLSPLWAVRLDVSGGFALDTPPQFIETGMGPANLVHRPASQTGRGSLGIEVRF